MKIYHKKRFAFGAVSTALGLLNLATGIKTGIGISDMILILALFLVGGVSITRSLSRKLSREDKLEEMDERNRLIELKSRSRALRLTQGICFVLLLVFLVAGHLAKENLFTGIGAGFAFAYTISMFSEVFSYLYCEEHN